MAKYLLEGRYAVEGAKGVAKEGGTGRRAAVTKMVEGLGGKLEAFYFAFGDVDVYVIVDLPDATAAAAVALAANRSPPRKHASLAGGARGGALAAEVAVSSARRPIRFVPLGEPYPDPSPQRRCNRRGGDGRSCSSPAIHLSSARRRSTLDLRSSLRSDIFGARPLRRRGRSVGLALLDRVLATGDRLPGGGSLCHT